MKQSTKPKRHPLKWTFDDEAQATLKALAEMGRSNAQIRQRTGFTNNEINYALGKSQAVEGKKGGYRHGWANGTSTFAKRVEKDYLAVLVQDTLRHLPVQILHPTPKTVRVDE